MQYDPYSEASNVIRLRLESVENTNFQSESKVASDFAHYAEEHKFDGVPSAYEEYFSQPDKWTFTEGKQIEELLDSSPAKQADIATMDYKIYKLGEQLTGALISLGLDVVPEKIAAKLGMAENHKAVLKFLGVLADPFKPCFVKRTMNFLGSIRRVGKLINPAGNSCSSALNDKDFESYTKEITSAIDQATHETSRIKERRVIEERERVLEERKANEQKEAFEKENQTLVKRLENRIRLLEVDIPDKWEKIKESLEIEQMRTLTEREVRKAIKEKAHNDIRQLVIENDISANAEERNEFLKNNLDIVSKAKNVKDVLKAFQITSFPICPRCHMPAIPGTPCIVRF
jgi:hypothetical protein